MADLLIVAGMSGAGRSTASATLEDLGWFVIDNVPAALITRVAALTDSAPMDRQRLAFVIGRSGTAEVPELVSVIGGLREEGTSIKVLFLDAADDVLIRRYEGTRRRHPLAATSVAGSIAQERDSLSELRGVADVLLETGELTSQQLRRRIVELFESSAGTSMMRTTILSFGYKYGMPRDVDVVLDCRFLPNPHWIDELRDLTGLDQPVREFVLQGSAESERFLDEVVDMLTWQLPAFQREGKSYLTVAFGCTGGRHRSVAIAEEVARRLGGIAVQHRDVER